MIALIHTGTYMLINKFQQRRVGLVGRPHQATTDRKLVNFSHKMIQTTKERQLVRYDRHRRAHANIENKRRFMHNTERKILQKNLFQKSRNGSNFGNARPIQQPRKLNSSNFSNYSHLQ